MTKKQLSKEIKEIRKKLGELYDFISADENQGFGFSLSETGDKINYLEKQLKLRQELLEERE